MDFNVWLAFFAASWVIAISPGSGAVLSMSHGLAYGMRRSSATIAGLQLGLAVILLIAGVGVGALLLASATAFTVVKVLGAAYLIWLGLKQWRAPVHAHAPAAGQALVNHLGVPTVRERVLTGFMTNVTNPKGIVFMVAVLPQFIDPHRPLWLQLLILLVTSIGVDLVVMHGYAFLASRAQRWLATARARRAQNRVFGGVLMAMGAGLMLVKRGGA
ncbi:MAG: LysE family transporter [Hydrogenophaga sp.]|jgi:homoserine/homoserine lactone efflux protein|uniref:LysE family transporter n=1 Tax=Hydrogenophaga sp. TaxID=1904254 RepID=UPI00271F0723|nr:LysE family transporter [Hydrogenophaga sp.]MDO9203728.1 LysE family transporter [Hydrogenophaga sp.]MDO9569690.1 LysE family transporter [Hydrogenophaga sp.]MDP1894121.1 LysE family transporter [Hydrogenophaga sp.]MDP3346423.1 LysE family transporter [Hydrogenophaga sp.]MDP3806222.1 LysE family transporter [Hydrogenophaga sp.]